MGFATRDHSSVSINVFFCKGGAASCASARNLSAVIVKFCIAKATLKTNPSLAPVRKIQNSSCCVQDESWCFANLKCKADAGTGAWRMGVFAKRKWKQGWRVSGNASKWALPKASPMWTGLVTRVTALAHAKCSWSCSWPFAFSRWGAASQIHRNLPAVLLCLCDKRLQAGVWEKGKRPMKAKPRSCACWWEAHRWHAPLSPCGARRKPWFLSCLQCLESHKLYSDANLFSVGSINLRSAIPLVGYPFLLILSSQFVAEGYLCSGLEHIREHKPGRMVKYGTVLIKGGGCVCSANIIHFGSKFFSAWTSQLQWGAALWAPRSFSPFPWSWNEVCVPSF